MSTKDAPLTTYHPDELPVSASAMLFDEAGRLLVLQTTYKSGWTLPGGAMEANGESPWDACRREVREETGLDVTAGRLAAIDTRPAKRGRKLGLRFLFDCGTVSALQIAQIRLQEEEISRYCFAEQDTAAQLLRKAVRRRVLQAWGSPVTVYLENGRLVTGVSDGAAN